LNEKEVDEEENSTQEYYESKKRKREINQVEEKKKRKIIKEMNDLQRKQFELMRQLYFSFPISNDEILKNILQFIPLNDILQSSIFFTCKSFYKYFNDSSSFWKEYSINLWGENQFKKEYNAWKQYLFERGRHTVEVSNQIQSFLSNPKSVDDIQFYIGAYQMSHHNCTYLKYFSNDNQIHCECLLWSLKFPKYVQLQFESSNGNIKSFLVDEVEIYLEDGSIDDYMIESARKSLEYPTLKDNEGFLEFIKVEILKFNIQ
jgi:hypothetical protein